MKTEWILGIYILIFTPCHGQLPFEVASEDLGNAEADFIDFFLSNPDMLFNALDINTETTTLAPIEPITLNSGTEHTGTQQSTNGTEHTDHGTEHTNHGTEHTDHGTEHTDHGTEHTNHTDHGTEHTDHGTEHTDHGTDHTDRGTEHTNHGSETAGNKDSDHGLVVENGLVRDPVSGSITHLYDIHDGALLEVIQSEITGGHVIDPHTGELILLSEISESGDTHAPQTATVSMTTADSTTSDTSGHNPPGESKTSETNTNPITSTDKIVNGVIRDPDTGEITHVVDPSTGEHLKVIESPIFGAHVFDSKTGDLIIAEDHALEHGTIDVQPQTLPPQTEAPPLETLTNIPNTITEATTKTAATTTTATTTTAATTTRATTTTGATTTKTTTTTTEATTVVPTLPDIHTLEALERTTVAATEKTFTTTVQTPLQTTTKNPDVFTQKVPTDHVDLHVHDNDHQNNQGIVIHNNYRVSSTSQTPSNRMSKNKPPNRRRKFGKMKGIYSILDKYKSEYLKTKRNRKEKYGDDNNNPNINKVLKWIERRKNQFKKVLHEKKHIKEEKKVNPNKRFKILDLETYFPSLKRNKFGGLQAQKKWRKSRKSKNTNTQSTLSTENNANSNRWRSRAIFQNPHSKKNTGAKQGNQQNAAKNREFNRLLSTRLNQKKISTKNNKKKTKTSTNTEISSKPTTTSTNTETSSKPTTNTTSPATKSRRKGKRRKFNNLFANRRRDFSRQKQKKQTPVNSDKQTDVENYVKSLTEKVTKNNPASQPEKQTAESYAADFARKINNRKVARDPKNVKLRKAKWKKSYLAGQTEI